MNVKVYVSKAKENFNNKNYEIFARHGYVSMPWYVPDPSFSGDMSELNDIEKYNVELIKSLE